MTSAQGVSKAQAGSYSSLAGLASGNRLPQDLDPLKIDAKQTAAGWAAAVKSDSGKVYLSTESAPNPRDVTGQDSCPVFDLLAPPPLFGVSEEKEPIVNIGHYSPGRHAWYVTAMNSEGSETTPSTYAADLVGGANVRLMIGDTPGATGYRIYRSETGDLADARLIDDILRSEYVEFVHTDEEHGQVWIYNDSGYPAWMNSTPPTVNTAVIDAAAAYGRLAAPELFKSGPWTDWDETPMTSHLAPGAYSYYISAMGGMGETTPSTIAVTSTGEATYAFFREVPGAWGYTVYRSSTGDVADAKKLRTIWADDMEEGEGVGRIMGFFDDGSTPLDDSYSPSSVNTSVASAPGCSVITDVASALASQR